MPLINHFVYLTFFFSFFYGTGLSQVFADDRTELIQGVSSKNRTTVIESIKTIASTNDAAYLPVLKALRDSTLRSTEDGLVVIVNEAAGTAVDANTGQPIDISGLELSSSYINNAVRRILSPTIAQLQLSSPDPAVRLDAAEELSKRPQPEATENLRSAITKETNAAIREAMTIALALTELQHEDQEHRIAATKILADSGSARAKAVLLPLIQQNQDGSFSEKDERVRTAAAEAIASIETSLEAVEIMANFFRGLSLGSVLLLAALGLAITFGLMKVINMAHGELIMLGCYATYVIQNMFYTYWSDWFSWYLWVAVPAAFLLSGAVGIAMERSVIRYLYGRPLETLLATWGLSLIIIQTIRLIFGAQNVEVANPQWLSGGMEIAKGFTFPYSRIAILVFTAIIVFMVWYLFQRTTLGLKVRAVTQNRAMASAMGISSSKIDMWTFGLGSGIAGLGGVALSQLGNVGPEMGQGYIIDSFMVVVLGGVGNIFGTVLSAIGLGLVNKYIEPMAGAVLGKIIVLIFIILFIQKRPQGIFAIKGRSAAED